MLSSLCPKGYLKGLKSQNVIYTWAGRPVPGLHSAIRRQCSGVPPVAGTPRTYTCDDGVRFESCIAKRFRYKKPNAKLRKGASIHEVRANLAHAVLVERGLATMVANSVPIVPQSGQWGSVIDFVLADGDGRLYALETKLTSGNWTKTGSHVFAAGDVQIPASRQALAHIQALAYAEIAKTHGVALTPAVLVIIKDSECRLELTPDSIAAARVDIMSALLDSSNDGSRA